MSVQIQWNTQWSQELPYCQNHESHRWIENQLKKLLPVEYFLITFTLPKVFRALLLKTAVDHNLRIPAQCPSKWVVDCRHVGKGDKALVYLGRYLYRGVIQEKDIVSATDTHVTFRYFHAKQKRYHLRTVTGEYFLWLILRHILPKGFRRVRSYGFLHPCSKNLIKLLQLILHVNPVKMCLQSVKRAGITCFSCGRKMKIVGTMIPAFKVQQAREFQHLKELFAM